jgi:hypothetical protein
MSMPWRIETGTLWFIPSSAFSSPRDMKLVLIATDNAPGDEDLRSST